MKRFQANELGVLDTNTGITHLIVSTEEVAELLNDTLAEGVFIGLVDSHAAEEVMSNASASA